MLFDPGYSHTERTFKLSFKQAPSNDRLLVVSYLTNGDLCQDVVAAEVAFIVVFHPVCFHEMIVFYILG